ncbi:MAG: PEP-CTERM sorting domain-containing protein [Bryobacterales bacterium]|nr:PEP-CTERM sorting domain-containing protein [Bryobacterales bacterium]
MKQVWCVLTLGVTMLASANASVVTISSLGSAADANESNSMGPTIVIPRNLGWAPAVAGSEWVSYGATGDPNAPGYFMPANGTIVSFFDSFFLAGSPLSGSVTIRADDSTSLWLNGFKLLDEAATSGNTYTRCSDIPVGCLESTTVTVDLTPHLLQGNNQLRFDVAQRNSISFGLSYAGTADSAPSNSDVPEPATFALIGAGLIALRLIRK